MVCPSGSTSREVSVGATLGIPRASWRVHTFAVNSPTDDHSADRKSLSTVPRESGSVLTRRELASSTRKFEPFPAKWNRTIRPAFLLDEPFFEFPRTVARISGGAERFTRRPRWLFVNPRDQCRRVMDAVGRSGIANQSEHQPSDLDRRSPVVAETVIVAPAITHGIPIQSAARRRIHSFLKR